MTHIELTTRIERLARGQALELGGSRVVRGTDDYRKRPRYCVYRNGEVRTYRTSSGAARRMRQTNSGLPR